MTEDNTAVCSPLIKRKEEKMVKVTKRESSLSVVQTMSVRYKRTTKGCYVKQAHLSRNAETSRASTKSLFHSHALAPGARPERGGSLCLKPVNTVTEPEVGGGGRHHVGLCHKIHSITANVLYSAT